METVVPKLCAQLSPKYKSDNELLTKVVGKMAVQGSSSFLSEVAWRWKGRGVQCQIKAAVDI